jgi:hypothetical protein
MSSNGIDSGTGRAKGLLILGAAAAVFVICSIVQAMGDSNMFSTSYAVPDSAIVELLMNVTFYPGWILTVSLAALGIKTLVTGD